MTARRSRLPRAVWSAAVAVLLAAVAQCGDDAGPGGPESPQCAAPRFTPPAGTYAEAQSVTIGSATPGASIHYTRDGSAPEETSPSYTTPLLVDETTTLRARAWLSGWRPSEIATATYILVRRVATPVLDPPAGSYPAPLTVTLTCATEGARITWTDDGSDPTEGSPGYTGPIEVTQSVTLQARAWKEGWEPSDLAGGAYEIGGCVLEVVRPGGGETWCAGREQEIRWTRAGACGERVRIELLRAGGVCAVISAETENDGSHAWTPAQCAGAADEYAVRVTDLEAGVAAESGGRFSIPDPCVLELTSPDGGESWTAGTTRTIRWNHAGCCGRSVRIELLRGGVTCATIDENAANSGFRDWQVAPCAETGAGYGIRVSDPTAGTSDESDAPFSILPAAACEIVVLEPSAGVDWCEGAERTIRWSHAGPCGNQVAIELLREGNVCATLAAATPNDGGETWTVTRCGDASEGYSLRVSDPSAGTAATSDGSFRIAPPCAIEVTSPAGAETWDEGSGHTVEWRRSGCCGSTARIELLRNGAICAILAPLTENDGSFDWRAAACPGGETGYTVRVIDLQTGAADESPPAFAIPAAVGCAIEVTAPGAGESWCEGVTQTIRWSTSDPCGPRVGLELLRHGRVCATVADATENDGSFDWTALRCAGLSDGYAIRVTDLSTGAAAASPGAFMIPAPCSMAVTSPDGGETWTDGTARTIRWISSGCCGPTARIELLHDGMVCAEIAGETENDGAHAWTAAACAGPSSGYAVRVTDLSAGVSDESDGLFTIPGTAACALQVTEPDAAASWCQGSVHEIRWSPTGPCGPQVRIDLWRNLGLCAVLADSTANDGVFAWRATQCAGQSSGYSIRVTDLETNAGGQSGGFFGIPDSCAVSLESPDGGESWCQGTSREIRWARSGCCGTTARIELLQNGIACAVIAAGTENDGSFLWTVAPCGDSLDGYAVRVVDLETGESDESGGAFAIAGACAVSVTSPNGGESWCEGSSREILWDRSACCGAMVRIELLRDGAVCSVLSAGTANDGSFTWSPARCGGAADGYVVRVVDVETGASDSSDGPFAIPGACAVVVTAPNGGESWCQGTDHEIRWNASGCCGAMVRLELLRNGVLCSTLSASTENDGIHAWTAAPCGGFTDRYTLRVVDLATGTSDQSDAFFSIPDPCVVVVTAPNGGESWCQGTSQEIAWERSGCCGANVRIELLRGGGSCSTIALSTPNDGSYVWTAAPCSGVADGYAIRVTDAQTGATDQSDAFFSIPAPCAVVVTAPNGGESWCQGTSHEIAWSASGCCGPTARIELARGGVVCGTIVAATANDGSFPWAAAPCGDFVAGYTVRVTDTQTGAAGASDSAFGIPAPCAVAVTAPNGGESWCEGTSHEIAWSASGCCGPTARIELLRNGVVCAEIAAATDNDGSFTWTAAPCGGFADGYTVRVTDTQTGATDQSDAFFSIPAPCAVAVTAPNGGEIWCQGEPIEIAWTAGGCCGPEVVLELFQDDVYCRTIAASTPNDGSFSWTSEGCAGDAGYRIRVADPETGATDLSDAAFVLRDRATEACERSPSFLEFGEVEIGQAAQLSFVLRNTGCAALAGEISELCDDFALTAGAGAYLLPPGDSVSVTVEFRPTSCGPRSCDLETGNAACGPVACAGQAVLDSCGVVPAQLDFGAVPVGSFSDLSFEITNHGCGPLAGEVAEDCPEFSIVSGGGAYALSPGESRSVTIRFEPAAPAPSACTIATGAGCAAVECAGAGSFARP